jgi:micrococcal nuclease
MTRRAARASALLVLLAACGAPVPAAAPRQQVSADSSAPPAPRSRGAAEPATTSAASACTVARVVDGDTLVCDDGIRVRLLLIDAPELSQAPFGEAAKTRLEELAGVGTVLRVEEDVRRLDPYGRLLAYLWLADGRMVNEELLRSGVAVVSVYPPNVRHVERLRAAVDSARAVQAGLWATDAFDCEPRDHRAGRC